MILDLDKLKEAGEIPRDLDAEIHEIMGLPMCDGAVDYWNGGSHRPYCEECRTEFWPFQFEFGKPHPRGLLPYSTDLAASRKVLEWVLRRTGSFAFEAEEIWREVTVGDHILNSVSVDFYNLSDEPLAIAVAVNALFGESK